VNRRSLLNGLALGTGAAATGAAVWPLAAAIVNPLREKSSAQDAPWVEVAIDKEVGATPLKSSVRVAVRDGFFTILEEMGAVWLRRGPDGKIVALSNTCPHLGCGVGLDPKGGFACPCHDSRFAIDGSYVRGPSPRSMDPLPVKVEEGRVLVQALRFATGAKARRPL
jgi:Rieske Fe-S protein